MKVSIQAACRIALLLYTREVYHTFRSKTTGEQPELSIKVILSITFFDCSVPHLHSFELFQLTVQPEQIFFQLGAVLFCKVVPVIQRLPQLFLHPPGKHRLKQSVQPLHGIFQRHAHLRPAHIGGLPGGHIVTGQIIPHPCRNDLPAALGGLQKSRTPAPPS